ncbi:MAG: hypothetical protein ACK5LJ_11115 [Paracoccus sp. (in: a-proteobacteria)]
MTHHIANAARFLVFYLLSAATTSLLVASFLLLYAYANDLPVADQADFIGQTMFSILGLSPLTLIISAWGWESGRLVLEPTRIRPAFRAALQGAIAWFCFYIFIGLWFRSVETFAYLSLIGTPIGAIWGWLVYCKLWPTPASAPI